MSKQVILDYEDHAKLLEYAEAYHNLKNSYKHTITVEAVHKMWMYPFRSEFIDQRIVVPNTLLTEELMPVFKALKEIADENDTIRSDIFKAVKKLEENGNAEQLWKNKMYHFQASVLSRLKFLFTGKLPK